MTEAMSWNASGENNCNFERVTSDKKKSLVFRGVRSSRSFFILNKWIKRDRKENLLMIAKIVLANPESDVHSNKNWKHKTRYFKKIYFILPLVQIISIAQKRLPLYQLLFFFSFYYARQSIKFFDSMKIYQIGKKWESKLSLRSIKRWSISEMNWFSCSTLTFNHTLPSLNFTAS